MHDGSMVQKSCTISQSPEKSSSSFGFCPIEGGRALPKFFGVQKKWYKLSKLVEGEGGGVGGRGNLDKTQKNSYFFRETFPYNNVGFFIKLCRTCTVFSGSCKRFAD